jgi:hypothetical protein
VLGLHHLFAGGLVAVGASKRITSPSAEQPDAEAGILFSRASDVARMPLMRAEIHERRKQSKWTDYQGAE